MKDITSRVATYFIPGARRYTATARTLHWLTALLIFAIVPLAWVFVEFKTPPGGREIYASAHKTLGLVVLGIVVVRLIWRLANPPPALPGRMAAWEKGASIASHWLLYVIFLVMPISGYLTAAGGSHPIAVFGLFDIPKIPVDHATAEIAEQVHLVGQWAVYAVVLLHIAATAWHLLVRRDAILDRMLPRQINAE